MKKDKEKPVILINRLLMTDNGWSLNFQSRIEKAIEKYGKDYQFIFYGTSKVLEKRGDLFDFIRIASEYAIECSDELLKLSKEVEIARVIFLEPFQFPYMQLIRANVKVPFDVFMHSSKDYNEFYKFDTLYNCFYESFPHLLVHSHYTGKSYNTSYSVVGGILDKWEKYKDKKNEYVWAGSRINDDVKGYEEFLIIVLQNPTRKFVMCVDKKPKGILPANLEVKVGLNSDEFIDVCAKRTHIISTANKETFGFSVMDAISKGCTPIVPNKSVYKEIIPEEFRYDSIKDIDFDYIAPNEILQKLTKKYSAKKFYKRLRKHLEKVFKQ